MLLHGLLRLMSRLVDGLRVADGLGPCKLADLRPNDPTHLLSHHRTHRASHRRSQGRTGVLAHLLGSLADYSRSYVLLDLLLRLLRWVSSCMARYML